MEFIPSPQVDEFVKKLIEDLNELSTGVNGIQGMIKWFIIPLLFVDMGLLLVLTVRLLFLTPHV